MSDISNNKICIIDYGVGNLLSVKRSLEFFGAETIITNDKEKILSSPKVILPGVGAFKKAMNLIKKYNLNNIIREVADKKIPLLGICLGMQLLFEESYEFGKAEGLGLIEGTIEKLPEKSENETIKIPSISCDKKLIRKERFRICLS